MKVHGSGRCFPPMGFAQLCRNWSSTLLGSCVASLFVICLGRGVGLPRAFAEFSSARLVCGGTGTATQAATGIDVANNAYIACVVDERIQLKIIGPDIDVDTPIETGGLAQGDPDFATNVRFDTYMCFSQLDEGDVGREVYIVQMVGGHLLPAKNISRKPGADDFAPRVSLASDGTPHVVWAQRVGEQTRVMYWNAGLPNQEAVFVALGDYPALDVDESGLVHFVYARGNDLWYNNSTGGRFNSERQVTTTPFEPESPASIGVDPQGNVLICFESKGSLYYSTKSPGSNFRPPRFVDSGRVLDPKMRVRIQGEVAIVYVKDTDIYLVSGQSAFLNPPQKLDLKETTDGSQGLPKGHPSLETDLSKNIHLSYIQDGKVFYTNNAAAPVAEFSANPTQGEVPLTVNFGDLSNGDIQVWEWDFGDGATSDLASPTHTFDTPGKYSVRLTVKGPGATESTQHKEDFIFVQNPFNTLRIPDQTVYPGQKEVWFPVIGSHKEEIYGFQLLGTYDPNFLSLRDFAHGGFLFNYTVVEALNPNPELFVANVCQEGTEEKDEKCLRTTVTFFEVGCIFDIDLPLDHPTIPAGQNQTLLELVFDVSGTAPQGAETQVALVNNPDLSRVHFNIFIVRGGFSVYPALTPSTVRIRIVEPPFPKFFLRGDADGNGKLDITDAIRILNFLFLGGTRPSCMDAADFSDTGRVDISQAVGLLNYLYQGGPQPAVPFPNKGLDPTPDALPDC